MASRPARRADQVIQSIREPLNEVFNEFVIIGIRRLEDSEEQKDEEEGERPYWFMSGNPMLGGALINWALQKVIAMMHSKGTLTYIDNDGNLKELSMSDATQQFKEE